MNFDLIDVGKRIKDRRKSLSMTQDKLAELMNISRSKVMNWEKGNPKSCPTLLELAEMCKLLECDLGYLLGSLECKTETAEFIQKNTGLTEKAIEILLYMHRNKLPDEFDINKTTIISELYSAFIEDVELTQFLLLGVAGNETASFSIADMLIDELEVFGNNSTLINFYRFQLNQVLLNFVDRYFEKTKKALSYQNKEE